MKHKISIPKLLEKPTTLAEKFHAKTSLTKISPETPFDQYPEEWKKMYFKSYARLPEIQLPAPKTLKNTFNDVIQQRSSNRNFSKEPLSISTISTLLYYSSGLKSNSPQEGKRFYPSAGGRYPLELYLLSLNSELPLGLYHYYSKNHSLEKLKNTKGKWDVKKYFNQEWIGNAGCIIFVASIFRRNTIKYGDRGYRYILTEAGHLGQNLYLVSSALDIACCANESFIDKRVNKLLDLHQNHEAVIYTLGVGNKSS